MFLPYSSGVLLSVRVLSGRSSRFARRMLSRFVVRLKCRKNRLEMLRVVVLCRKRVLWFLLFVVGFARKRQRLLVGLRLIVLCLLW